MITVKRGTTTRISPGQSLTVECPVEHCGKLFNVTWCKFSHTSNCEIIPNMENIKIRQKQDQNKLISYLSFTQVSIKDDGLYRCDLGFNHNSVGHAINISVSGPIFSYLVPRFTDDIWFNVLTVSAFFNYSKT
ncbi:hypothetical protein ATANTOWER_011743 [Ataeniobius toweri]|uniref:Ig-like domain-containing protein n=1 Tax=Ataeniobius toweri TaxID=208326 RepID=A0ABU7BY46_9TELE|nr:hypothetical protein [Ataeniobius toweri]